MRSYLIFRAVGFSLLFCLFSMELTAGEETGKVILSDGFEEARYEWKVWSDASFVEQMLTNKRVHHGKTALEGTVKNLGWINHYLVDPELDFVVSSNTVLSFWYYAEGKEGFERIGVAFWMKKDADGNLVEKRYEQGDAEKPVKLNRWTRVKLNLAKDISSDLKGATIGGRKSDSAVFEIFGRAQGEGQFIIDEVKIEDEMVSYALEGTVFFDGFEENLYPWNLYSDVEANQYITEEIVHTGKAALMGKNEGSGTISHYLKDNCLYLKENNSIFSFWYYAEGEEGFERIHVALHSREKRYFIDIRPVILERWMEVKLNLGRDLSPGIKGEILGDKDSSVFWEIAAMPHGSGTFIIDDVQLENGAQEPRKEKKGEIWGQFIGETAGAVEDHMGCVPHLYWFGELYFFNQKPMDILQDGWKIVPRSGGDLFGVGFRWPKPLKPGYIYEFYVGFETFPDFITIDGHKVWDYSTGRIEKGLAVFTYVPDSRAEAMIWSVRDSHGVQGNSPIILQHQFGVSPISVFTVGTQTKCLRYPQDAKTEIPQYEAWNPPYKVWQSEKVYARLHHLERIPVKWDKPALPKPDYPIDDIDILEMDSWYANTPGFLKFLSENGINGLRIHGADWHEKYYNNNIEAFKEYKLNAFSELVCSPSQWWYPGGAWGDNEEGGLRPWLKEGISAANSITEDIPDARVYLLYVEDDSPRALFLNPRYSDYRTKNNFKRLRKMFEIYQGWKKEKILAELKYPDRCFILTQSGSVAYPAGYFYKKGIDVVTYTHNGRQNIEIGISNARGAARAYHKKFGFDYDPWSGPYLNSHHPDEYEQVFFLWYFTGADVLTTEAHLYWYGGYPQAPHLYPDLKEELLKGGPNAFGEAYLKAVRFMKTHPERGEHIVKIAIVRGFGGLWNEIGVAEQTWGKGGEGYIMMGPHPDNFNLDEVITCQLDYNLLNVFFSNYGDYNTSNIYRFGTGTPFGQVDMIPWDTPLEHLKSFDLIIYLGINGMDESQYHNLKEYVKDGGKAVIAVGQLQIQGDEPRKLYAGDYENFLGLNIITKDGIPALVEENKEALFNIDSQLLKAKVNSYYQVRPVDCEILVKTHDGKPIVTKRKYGKGEVYFYATRFMSKLSQEVNEKFLSSLAENAKILDFSPASTWLEYVVREKKDTYILALFNHGRVGFPSGTGIDQGIWKGTITLDLDKFPKLKKDSLEAFIVNPENFGLTPLPARKAKDKIFLKLKIDKRVEVILGPKGRTKKHFFFGES